MHQKSPRTVLRKVLPLAELLRHNTQFKDDCEKLNIKPTTTQLSKWRRGKGYAYKKLILHNTDVHLPQHAKIDPTK
jgi:hypothetical protein